MAYGNVDKEMTNALNVYFEEQTKFGGKCLVDYAQFDTFYEQVYSDKPVADARAVIVPRGGTALVDAIGRGATELGAKLKRLPEAHRPGTVLVVIVTDGGENSSREYTADQVREIVTRQENDYNWEFVFLGANIDAVAVGGLYGFKAGSSMTYDTANTEAVMASLNNYSNVTRGGLKANFSDEDRKKAVQKK